MNKEKMTGTSSMHLMDVYREGLVRWLSGRGLAVQT